MRHRSFELRPLHPSSFILHPSRRRGGFTHSAAPRRAFTLVELLVVIVIIGMLAALITAAAAKAVNTAKRSQITLDLDQFETAFQSYRNDTSGNFPPDMSYPGFLNPILFPTGPAPYVIRQNRIMAHLRKTYPRALIQGYGTAAAPLANTLQWWTQNWFMSLPVYSSNPTHLTPSGDIWGNLDNLDPAEALVFWLGGLPIPTAPMPLTPNNGTNKWLFTVVGFNANKQTPFAVGGSRTPGPYEFSSSRLGDADGDGWPEYYPAGAAVPQPPGSPTNIGNPVPPYVYFDAASYDAVAIYDSGATPGTQSNNGGYNTYPSAYPINASAFNAGNNATQPFGYAGTWGLAVPYAATLAPVTATTANVTWVNDKKFQLISAGIDTLFSSPSCGTIFRVNFPLFPTPQQFPMYLGLPLPGVFTLDFNDPTLPKQSYGEWDNQANFTSGTLQDGSTQ